MMTNKFILEDLTMVLEAIQVVRARWIAKIDEKTWEYMELHPGTSFEKAQREVITCQEVHEIHMSLVALYSCIGGCTDRYIGALKSYQQESEKTKRHLFIERRSKKREDAA